MQNTPHHYMQQALVLAARGRYTVSPNPMVGCVIVNGDEIVGTGYHQRAGEPHAEIDALNKAGNRAQGATAYVTLEPCAHHGRTPPCYQRLIEAGIKKVYAACLDPNPLVHGKGIDTLRAAGIEVDVGLCQQEAEKLNEIFFHYITLKKPFVICKWAMSLDGKTITHHDDSPQISSSVSQQHCHHLRQSVDAIIVGANTIRNDNPQLTVRVTTNNEMIQKQPIRIIISSKGELPRDAAVFSQSLPSKAIVVSTEPASYITNENIENLVIKPNKAGQVDLPTLLDELAKKQISSVLVEGGMTLHHSFMQENLVNQYHVYIAHVIIGQLAKKRSLTKLHMSDLNEDIHVICGNKEEASCLEG